MPSSVLVTGDVVLDCHLYGVPTAAYVTSLGGATLPFVLLRDSVAAGVKEWREAKRKAEKDAKPRIMPGLDLHLGIDTTGFKNKLPDHLRSYGVWTDHAKHKDGDPKTRVWRVNRDFGYGPAPSKVRPKKITAFMAAAGAPTSPVLTVIDDGALLFRHGRCRDAWPKRGADNGSYFLLKMSAPLCRGDLWAEMAPVMDRLIVIVSANDLRREDVQVSRRLSWEQCAEDTFRAFRDDPTTRALGQAAHVIINFQSAGALWVRRTESEHSAQLIFDPVRLEGDYGRQFQGNVYGRQTCLTVGVAYHLLKHHSGWNAEKQGKSPFTDSTVMGRALEEGIRAGLVARRTLLELGHGAVGAKTKPGFPSVEIGKEVVKIPGGFQSAAVPDHSASHGHLPWSILRETELGAAPPAPLVGLANLAALYGADALSHVPALRMGRLFTVDRGEIQSLRTLESLISAYENSPKVQTKPLSIGVFGPPGAGKSFGVKALAQGVLGERVPFLEFNLSQFKGPDDLIGAFHRVRDAVLGGVTPVAFWDEFDSKGYEWLQYLLAPMQDGAFQEREITHPIGKCIFVFAGGTSPTLAGFGVPEPVTPTSGELDSLTPDRRAGRERRFEEEIKRYQDFRLLKGPDFVSRLHGFLNVLGPSTPKAAAVTDVSWPVRRARLLRTLLGLKDGDLLDIDAGLLHALIAVPELTHGARSFEKIVGALISGQDKGRIHRAALPPDPVLARETNVAELHRLMNQHHAFKHDIDIDVLAVAIHQNFLSKAELARHAAQSKNEPGLVPTIHASVQRDFDDLNEDKKAANRAAARRIPAHLSLIDFRVLPLVPGEDDSWKGPLTAAIERHVDRLARAEHLGWCAERIASGWTYATVRDDEAKRHNLLLVWAKLSPVDQDKDRWTVSAIPRFLEVAGYKAVPAGTV